MPGAPDSPPAAPGFFTEERVAECRSLFDALDTSATGFVLPKDLRDIFTKLGKNIEISFLGDAFKALTPGQKRYIDLESYVSVLQEASDVYAKDAVSAMSTMFRLADNDEDGVISMDAFRTLLDILLDEKNEETKKAIIRNASLIDSEHVTFHTFVELLCGTKL